MLPIIATIITLMLAGLLLGAMFLFIRITADESDKYSQLKEMVETLFATPAHLRREADAGQAEQAAAAGSAVSKPTPAFTEPCPACDQTVTERDSECPSCGLRLL